MTALGGTERDVRAGTAVTLEQCSAVVPVYVGGPL